MNKFCRFAIAVWFAALFASCSSHEEVAPVVHPEEEMAFVTVPDRSEVVTEAAVRSVAALFDAAPATRAGEREIGSIHTLRSQAGAPLCYVVNYTDDKGFIIVSATKDYMPVLAFSDEGSFDVTAVDKTGVSVWLAEQQAVIERAAELPDSVRLRCRAMWEAYNTTREPFWTEPVTRSDADVVNLITRSIREWEADGYTVYRLLDFKDTDAFRALPAEVQQNLLQLPYGYANSNYGGVYAVSYVLKKDISNYTQKGPYTTTLWHQGSDIVYEQKNSYNQCLPTGVLIGCVPVAVGQIMKYWRYPATYDWDAMLDNNVTLMTAEFLKSVGIKVGIDYNSGDSKALIEAATAALKDYGYAEATQCGYDKDKTITELNRGRLVYMRGQDTPHLSGHAWVCDGYYNGRTSYQWQLMTLEYCPSSYEPTVFLNPYTYTDYVSYTPLRFHMNWGWGGTNNGYYGDDNLWVALNNGNYNFAGNRQIIINIYPVN